MRIRIDLSYDGAEFSGWARQPGRRTVQGVLEAACERVLPRIRAPQLTVAGRTDAGVHARGQVAHLDIPRAAWEATPGRSDRSPEVALAHRLNAVLPGDVAIRSASVAPPGFDARFSASWRRYSYRVTYVRDPLERRYALRHEPLQLEALNAAAHVLLGERDFAPFCKARPGATAIRTLQEFRWEPWGESAAGGGGPGPAGHGVRARVRADAFCHHMVRSLVGACLAVGSGRRDEQWLQRVAQSTERSPEVQVAPAHPLILEEVGYPAPEMLAETARRSRSVRTLAAE